MRVRTLLLVALTSFVVPAHSQHICWVQQVQEVGESLEIQLRPGYEGALRSIRRRHGVVEYPNSRQGVFWLREDETALLSTLPHDSCIVTGTQQGGRFGVSLSASGGGLGLPRTESKFFVPAQK